MNFYKQYAIYILVFILVIASGCDQSTGINAVSKSGSEISSNAAILTQLARYTMPSEISAVPTNTNDTVIPSGTEDPSDILLLPAGADGTDYTKAETVIYVEEKTLKQFEKLESILNAVNQTQYEEEIGNGPYKAIVAFEEEEEGRNIKRLQTWVVQSDAVQTGDVVYLRVRAWIEARFEEGTPLIKAEFKIFSPPTVNADGSYQDYGEWLMNIKLDDTGEDDYFTASCKTRADGYSVLKLYEKLSGFGQLGEVGLATRVRAVMYRKASRGYGKVYYPDYEAFFCPECDKSMGIPHKTVSYAYDENHLAIEEDGNLVFKDRNSIVKMTHRYGVYDAVTGVDVMKTKSFGFPVRYSSYGYTKHAYYGAWRGRHEIWTNDGSEIPQGTTVIRDDQPLDDVAETYTVGETYYGVMAKRTYANAVIEEIQGIPIEVFIDKHFNLLYDTNTSDWLYCEEMNWGVDPPVCLGTTPNFGDTIGFETLVADENNYLKEIHISGWDSVNNEVRMFVYEEETLLNPAGFYEAVETFTDYGAVYRAVIPRQALDPNAVSHLWVDIFGTLYLEFKNDVDGWIEKKLAYFDEINWVPVFDESSGDIPFDFPLGEEIYVNMQGADYIVQRDVGGYAVKREIQTVVNPVNASTLVPDGTLFRDSWDPDNSSTYAFITDASDPDYLMLTYSTIGENDLDFDGFPLGGIYVGGIVQSVWGIENPDTGDQFNWEYDEFGDMWRITYLMEGNSYKLLDDPLTFTSIEVTNNAGETRNVVLEYDGWMSGLPDLYNELEKADWVMSTVISDKIINLPKGLVLETQGGKKYVVKPLEVSLFLSETADPGDLDVSAAYGIDLYDVPIFEEHGMGDVPDVDHVTYSEGIRVE